jgi:hypothetical protein
MKTYNALDMKGRLYNYALQVINTEKGEAISGDVTLEVDDQGTTVTVRYFGYPTYSSGKTNKTYGILDDMMAGNYKTVVDNGEDADWLALAGSIDVSYFVSKNSQDDELARAQKFRGSFINPNKEKKYNNKWKLDLIITKVAEVEADEEKKLPRFVRVTGYLVDDYNERVMEVVFQARSEGAMNYILGLEASYDQPYYVSTWGQMLKVSRLVVRKNAFGEDETDEYNSSQWVITGMNPEPYEWGDEKVMTDEKYQELRANLEAHKEAEANKDNDGEGGGKKPELAF